MSRGLGRVQRRILDLLKHEANPIPTSLLAAMVFTTDETLAKVRTFDKEIQMLTLRATGGVKPKQRNAVSRACHSLWHDRQISAYTVDGNNWTWWGLPQKDKQAKRRRKRVRSEPHAASVCS
jgi:hypothetical protein